MNTGPKDITNRADIEQLVNSFYEQVLADNLIGVFFTDVVPVNWEQHLPVMYDFWESLLLDNPKYSGNPMQAHLDLHRKRKLQPEHFERWLEIFERNLRKQFKGPVTEKASQRAQSIATMIRIKTSEN